MHVQTLRDLMEGEDLLDDLDEQPHSETNDVVSTLASYIASHTQLTTYFKLCVTSTTCNCMQPTHCYSYRSFY